ncbi:uncharacterized protein LOC105394046 isoform X2 [Plutella xylostella]|uniref:uncharacterized protein LOC105394046 isoform X2 n=1 Tax=Plutella xylostella TaxID=51655 RepID=UPI0020322C04|nr:uncharacterized protein LOC105394046 isoform X2 [Plutella xylostella]
MSNPNVDNDGFRLVGSKKRISKRKPTKVPERDFKIEQQDTIIDLEKSKQRILAAVDDLRSSPYYHTVTNSVKWHLLVRSQPL